MFNFNSKKTRKVMSTAIILILVVCMILPIILSALA